MKQLQSIAGLVDRKSQEAVINLKEAMGIVQHHDAITGTEKQVVSNDYTKLLDIGVTKCEAVVNDAYARLLPKQGAKPIDQQFCHGLNISECAWTENNDKIAVTLWNPRGQAKTIRTRLPVRDGASYTVSGPSGASVTSELVDIPKYVQDIPGRTSNATKELIFEAELPASGYSTFFVEKTKSDRRQDAKPRQASHKRRVDGQVAFRAKTFAVLFDENGALNEVKMANGQRISLKQDFR